MKRMSYQISIKAAAAALLSLTALAGLSYAQQSVPVVGQSNTVNEVWKREELYWQLTQKGDIENYRKLWDEGFRGWPCKNTHTSDKSGVGGLARDKGAEIKI